MSDNAGTLTSAPKSKREAAEQHRNGHAHAWLPCPGCFAGQGRPCVSLAIGRRRGSVKLSPCASRSWTSRRARDERVGKCSLCRCRLVAPGGDVTQARAARPRDVQQHNHRDKAWRVMRDLPPDEIPDGAADQLPDFVAR